MGTTKFPNIDTSHFDIPAQNCVVWTGGAYKKMLLGNPISLQSFLKSPNTFLFHMHTSVGSTFDVQMHFWLLNLLKTST